MNFEAMAVPTTLNRVRFELETLLTQIEVKEFCLNNIVAEFHSAIMEAQDDQAIPSDARVELVSNAMDQLEESRLTLLHYAEMRSILQQDIDRLETQGVER